MQASVTIGRSLNYQLEGALLVYRRESCFDGARANEAEMFLTRHGIERDPAGVPSLGPARLLDRSFLDVLFEETRGRVPLEILPAAVLARTSESVCWWTPAGVRVMFYMKQRSPELAALSGGRFPQPALVWEVKRQQLRIRALRENTRPDPKTTLFRAPFWNVSDDGRVCLGSTRVPKKTSVDSLPQWEAAFFESEFSHPNGSSRLTEHPGGFIGLWTELKGKRRFPASYLSDAGETLERFLRS